MINLPPLHSTKRIDVKALPAVLKSWQIGQILESRAKTSSNAQGELQVQIGHHLLDARTKTPIMAGEELRLQIASLGHEPLLKILGSPVETDAITIFLRQAVPNPGSIQKVLNLFIHLQKILPDTNSTDNKDIEFLSKQIKRLIQFPVKAETVSSDNIRQFLQQSGFNLEKNLATQGLPAKDFKLELIQLKQTIEQLITKAHITISKSDIIKNPEILNILVSTNRLPVLANFLLYNVPPVDKTLMMSILSNPVSTNPELLNESQTFIFQAVQKLTQQQVTQLKQWIQFIPTIIELRSLIEQSLHTITNNQLQTIQAEADSAFMLLFNLLVAKNPDWIDLFNIRINKEESNQDDEQHWSVTIQLDMPGMGAIEAKLILVKKQLHTSFTSESEITHRLIQEHLPVLESALSQAGFNVATLSCKQEKVQHINTLQAGHGPLLDDQA
ncbi:MAG: flagellar hook-length control protein FliK [Gammaproteobacteria bacterium]|nr:flagellar hook-length control protein FliK [Gammaproteobacteria bacterium]